MLKLSQIQKIAQPSKTDFFRNYLDPRQPVVMTDLTKDWPGLQKWTPDFFKSNYGDLMVPVSTPNYSKPGKKYMSPDTYMTFSHYLELIDQGPIPFRIFLWNLFKAAPELIDDFTIPDIMDGFLNDYPFMFFGGQGSITAMHYDIDLSHVFLNQLHGRKRVILFDPDQSRFLYRHPFTVASYVDVDKPDYEKYPALAKVQGFETILHPGESLFIPCRYWHYIEYLDGGYSISLRANDSTLRRVQGALNIATHYLVDKGMNKVLGSKWRQLKESIAQKRAEAELY